MANMFEGFKSTSKAKSKSAKFSTRSATPSACIAVQTAVFHNKFKDNVEEQKFRLLFSAKVGEDTISQWTPWIVMSKGMFDAKSNAMKLFDQQSNVLENVGDIDWLFKQQWSVLGVANGDYVNIKTIFHEDGDLTTPASYDLAGYPPFKTAKCYGEVAPITEMYVRLEDGSKHKVEDAEFKTFTAEEGDDEQPF